MTDTAAPQTKRWRVETRATIARIYFVTAPHERAAAAASIDAQPEHEEELDEETMSIVEVAKETQE
jgi:hypothetical protein